MRFATLARAAGLAVALLLCSALPALAQDPSAADAPPAAAPAPPPYRRPVPYQRPSTKQVQSRPVSFLLRMNFDGGGATIYKFQREGGGTETVTAGGFFGFAGGIYIHPEAPWALDATVGFKVDDVTGSNGSASFSRVPLELIGSFRSEAHHIGAGLTMHLNPKKECDVTGECSENFTYDNAVGAIVQYAYRGSANGVMGFEGGLRYTIISYQGTGLEKQNGSSFGGFLGFFF